MPEIVLLNKRNETSNKTVQDQLSPKGENHNNGKCPRLSPHTPSYASRIASAA